MIAYVMVVCTAGWIMCGQQREVPMESRAACVAERAELYRTQGRDAFKYIICRPRTAKDNLP